MIRFFFITGAIFMGMAITIGAATGHQSAGYSEMAKIWIEKGIRYQAMHGLALLLVAIAIQLWPAQGRLLIFAGCSFIVGVVLFCFSLYLMAFTPVSAGYITPLGGIAFLAGWLAMAIAGLSLKG